jgi:hypothetical protein
MRKILLSFLLTFLSFNLLSQFCSSSGLSYMGFVTPNNNWQNVSNSSGAKRYWRFNATAGCVYDFSTCNSAFTNDTYLRLYSSGTGGTILASNDDNGVFCGGTKASLSWTCTTSGTYSILVTNYSCSNLSATTILSYRVTCNVPAFNPCSTITSINCGSTNNFTVASGNGAYNPPSTSCGFSTPGKESIYSFTPIQTGSYTITQNSSFGWIDYFFKLSSSGCSGTGWTCIDDLVGNSTSITFNLLAGQTYYIMADPESTSGGNVSFTINCPVSVPSNDLICNATTINCGQNLSGTTIGSSNSGSGEGGSCGTSQTTGGVWYKIVGTGDLITASLCATSWDSKMSVFEGNCSSPICIGGIDDSGPACAGTSASYQWLSNAGTTYWILVHGYSTTSTFNISITCTPPPTTGPCFGDFAYSVSNMPTDLIQSVVTTCSSGNGQYTTEYSTWNNGVAGETYNVESSILSDWITVTFGSPSGTVVSFGGGGVLQFVAAQNGTYYIHVNTNGFCGDDGVCRDITVYKNISLPIELMMFDGIESKEGNLLYWITASEFNNDYFTLERSVDGYNWVNISNLNAIGNSQEETSYSYLDNTYRRGEINYYRLSQTDFDGQREYFNIVSIDNSQNQKKVVKMINSIGQEVDSFTSTGVYIILYDDGSIVRMWK